LKDRYVTIKHVSSGIALAFLLLVPSFPIWQTIHASQTENVSKTVGDPLLYYSWLYFRKYALEGGNANESSTRNDSAQESSNRSLILQEGSDGTRLDPGDLEPEEIGPEDLSMDGNILTKDYVVEELRSLNSTQVADFPLQELSSDEIIEIFNILSDTDLQKVLGNTKPENLQIIFAKVPGELHDLILSRLDSSTKSYVESSIGGMLS
jgi:hypothetical protein